MSKNMGAAYANKFRIELSDVARIIFIDERPPIAEGLPMASVTSAEVVLTLDNFSRLLETMDSVAKKHSGRMRGDHA